MEEIIEIVKYTIPSIFIFTTTIVLVKWFLKNDENRRKQEFLLTSQKEVIPVKMRAYERCTLFLERISAESIVLREQPNAITARELQLQLIQSIRTEYEHNLAMQVHLPAATWLLIKNAKEEMIKCINISMGMMKDGDISFALGKTILEQYPHIAAFHFNKALDGLKADIQLFYN